ncbi:hypothetical protein R83H12_00708 [Fibrobacteria bacterium R8-3-H12]
MRHKILGIAIATAIFAACSAEDPSVEEFDLQKIRFIKDTSIVIGTVPFEAYFTKPESYTQANKQADLFYAMSNGDTMKISICEYENTTLAKAFFYSSDSIVEKDERLIGGDRKRFFRWGRRIFIFSYQFSISQNSSILDSLMSFIRRFPAADTSTSADFHSFSLKNSHPDKDFSVQRTYFFGVEAPFNMLVRRYRDLDFSWACARSSGAVSEKDWENYKAKWQNNVYGSDSAALISRLPNGIVAAVYGNLDKERMQNVFNEFTALIK